MTQILCYTYEADHHCIDCARDRFPMMTELDNNGATDNEGNPVGVVFTTDDMESYAWGGLRCDCGHEIIENGAGNYRDPSEIHQDFMTNILPSIKETYEQDGIPDKPARREAFNNWIDSLDICESIKSTIDHPHNLESA